MNKLESGELVNLEQESYKFASANGLGNAGVVCFNRASSRLGKGAKLKDIRTLALDIHEKSKAETEVITRTVSKTVSDICMDECGHQMQFDPDEIDERNDRSGLDYKERQFKD